MKIHLRLAVPADIPVLRELIDASVRGLQTQDYTSAQIDGALQTVFGVDSQLIADGTYVVAEANLPAAENAGQEDVQPAVRIVGCGGWCKGQTLCRREHLTVAEGGLRGHAHAGVQN